MKPFPKNCLGLLAAIGALFHAAQAAPPNIIVIFTDDMGYADVGAQGQVSDLKTPNIDRLALEGARFTSGYTTAPQCIPARAALLSGQYNTAIGVDDNAYGPLPLEVKTIAEQLSEAGYRTGHVGKWHLRPNWTSEEWIREHMGPEAADNRKPTMSIPDRDAYGPDRQGFRDIFDGALAITLRNYELDGTDVPLGRKDYRDEWYRLDLQTEAALSFIKRAEGEPFFLYLAYYAPHVPLEAPKKYLSRFPGDMPERRRYALAMISAMDDGVGRILEQLEAQGVDDNTLIFFISDNGAPLKLTKEDLMPIKKNGWDGSLNDPWTGEKGTLLEGGIRVPFMARWPVGIPPGRVIEEPVMTIDVAATAVDLAGLAAGSEFDGRSLVPLFHGSSAGFAERPLFWRFWNQAAVREGQWKYLRLSDGRNWLFDLSRENPEQTNLLAQRPEVAAELNRELEAWAAEQARPGLPSGPVNVQEVGFFDHHLP